MHKLTILLSSLSGLAFIMSHPTVEVSGKMTRGMEPRLQEHLLGEAHWPGVLRDAIHSIRAGLWRPRVLVPEEDMGKLPELQVQLFLAVRQGEQGSVSLGMTAVASSQAPARCCQRACGGLSTTRTRGHTSWAL